MSQALVQRWDAFLKSIQERFEQIMQEARDGCMQLARDSSYDPVPWGNAWGAMERRAKDLDSKIRDTWQEQVEPKFEEAGAPPALIQQQAQKGEALCDWMELEIERTGIQIECTLARELAEIDERERRSGFPCRHCGAPLPAPITHQTVNLTCPYCRTVNEYEPGMRTRFIANSVDALSKESAWSELVAMRDAERAYHRARPHTIQHIRAWEAAQSAYLRKYLTTRLQYLPDQAASFAKDLASRMEQFYINLENDAEWAKAGRQRAPL